MAHAATDASIGVVPVLFDKSPPRSSTAAGRKTASLIGTTPSGPHRRSRRTELYRCLRQGWWEARGMGSAWMREGSRGRRRLDGVDTARRCALAATLSRGKKEGGGRDLRAPRAAVRNRRAILTGQSLGKDAISPPARTFGESTRVRRRRGGAFRPRRRVDILSHVSSSEIVKRTTRGSTRPRSGSRAFARSCSAAAPAAYDRSCLQRISCRIAYR